MIKCYFHDYGALLIYIPAIVQSYGLMDDGD